MLCKLPKLIRCLDLLLLIISLSSALLLVYLVAKSIESKLADCQGFYTQCRNSRNSNSASATNNHRFQYNQINQVSSKGRSSSSIVEDEEEFLFFKDLTALVSHLLDKHEISSQFVNNSQHTHLVPRDSLNNLRINTVNRTIVSDWIGLSQYAILIALFITNIIGSFFAYFRKRQSIFIILLICLVLLIQLILIEASDDRDFPTSVYRDEFSIARYSLLYTPNTIFYLLLKISQVILFFSQFALYLIYFVVLRYEHILENL